MTRGLGYRTGSRRCSISTNFWDATLKCTVRFRHLLSESADGIQIQMYCALIATLLIVLWTGRKPTKRTWEMVQFYFQGWASAEDVQAHIASLKRTVT